MDYHLTEVCPKRNYKCKICGEEGTYAEMTGAHAKLCNMAILQCTNTGCTKTMKHQEEVEDHVANDCEHALLPCKYEIIGCGTKMKKQDMAAHIENNKQLHLDMAVNTTLHLKKKIDRAAKRQSVQQPPPFKMTRFQEYKEKNRKFICQSSHTISNGYHIALTVHANGRDKFEGTHISVCVTLLKGNLDESCDRDHDYDYSLRNITVTLLNQLEDEKHYSSAFKTPPGISCGRTDFIPLSELGYNPPHNRQYLKDDTLYFRVEVEVVNKKPWLV